MKKKKQLVFLGVILCLLAVGIWGWISFHQGRPSLKSEKPDFTIGAAQLLQAYLTSEDRADRLYLGKVLEVTGQVAAKTTEKDHSSIQISSGDNPSGGGINCALRTVADGRLKAINKGQTIKIKGRCVGYLLDVNLVDAVIVP